MKNTIDCIKMIRAELSGSVVDGYNCVRFNDFFMDVEGAIYHNKDTAHVVFRCTDSRLNWFTNFMFWLTKFVFARKSIAYGNKKSKVRVHLGFYLGYIGYARGFIHSWLESNPDIRNIRFTGHSLGAAHAVLCALDVQYNYGSRLDNIECITFGCPRIGNKAFVESFDRRVIYCIRYENANDIVTHVPPSIFGFSHVGLPRYLSTKKGLSFKAHELDEYAKLLQ